MKVSKTISIVTAGLVLFLASAAFILSYDALHGLALQNGIKPSLAWLWPLTLDAFMIAASLAVLRSSLNKEHTLYPWALVGAFTLASVIFNVIHANDLLLAQAIAALPPVVVFLAFELLMGQSKATIKRQTTILSIDELDRQATEKRQTIDSMVTEIDKLTAKRDSLAIDVDDLKRQKRQAGLKVSDDTRLKAAAILAERSGLSGAELGRQLGRSASLGRQLKRELLPIINENGKEGEV